MPVYGWKCNKCNAELDVVRSVADYQTPPDSSDMTEEEKKNECEHEWSRTIGSTQFSLQGRGWFRDGYS